jgi:hypothetical protein
MRLKHGVKIVVCENDKSKYANTISVSTTSREIEIC